MSKLFKLIALTCGLGIAAASQDLPDREGAALVREKCVVCHEADLIVQQRLTRAGWTREVDKMIRWGTVVTSAERDAIINYLSNTPSVKLETASGRKIFEEKCLLCHETDLSSQQRLSRAGWTREVDKMIRWGATVSESEKPRLIDYLVEEYGGRK